MGVGIATLERDRFHVPCPPANETAVEHRELSTVDMVSARATVRLLSEVIAVRIPAGRMRPNSDRAGFAAVIAILDELATETHPVTEVRVVRLAPGIAPGSADAVVTVEMGDKVRAVDVQLCADGPRCHLVGCVLL